MSRRDLVTSSTLCIAATVFYLWVLLKPPLIPGIDGPYYLIQVEAILAGKGMVYGDPPLVFYVASLLAFIFGDTRLGVSVAVAFFCGLSSVPTYLLAKKITGNEVAAVASAIVVSFSPQMVRMASDLMKNASGVCFLMLSIYFLHISVIDKSFRHAIIATITSYLAFLTHSLDFAYTLLYIFSYLIIGLIVVKEKKKFLGVWSIIPLVLGIVVGISASLFPWHFSDIHKGVAFVKDILFPTSVSRGKRGPGGPPSPILSPSFMSVGYSIPFIVAGIFLFVDSFPGERKRLKKGETFIIFASIIGGLLGILPALLGLREWAWRFMLMEHVPVGILAGVIVSRIKSRYSAAALAVVIIIPILAQTLQVAESVRPSIPYEGYLDLLEIKDIIGYGSPYVPRCRFSRYWFEYILGRREISKPRYLLYCPYNKYKKMLQPPSPSPPPGSRLLFRGKVVWLYELGGM